MIDEDTSGTDPENENPVALEARSMSVDGRLYSPSTGRNKGAVREAFLANMPNTGTILEVASGTGEHGAHITREAHELIWQYSDIDTESRCSQNAWAEHHGDAHLLKSICVDTCLNDWGDAETTGSYDGMFCANMLHIAPFEAAAGLFAGANRVLSPEGRLFVYGPFKRKGKTAPSNEQFSQHLQSRNVQWGVRDLDREIVPMAEKEGFVLDTVVEMPSNNLGVVFKRA